MNELIQQARELCEKAMPEVLETLDELGRSTAAWSDTRFQMSVVRAAYEISTSRTLIPQLCDALEAAQKENERLQDDITSIKQVSRDTEQIKELLAENETLTARAEKAEAELSELRTPTPAVSLKIDRPVQIGHVQFGAGCTVWKCPRCGTFLTPIHKYCLE